ncbi:GT2 family glycosyltransferase [Rhodoblastus acidophilus]|uniref:glycosyltransferase n=1 Tax=Rhodoblastus acidophilus TaxID=1074 RepID=UPI0022250465|nr:glycosyltransferase [Rhodoblastus acidophilus]MCW2282243.1 GT2 family glycosyltransferase [Rhodoblastus acidophilus]MCW2331352.1 GT2 family glycosyltransferase [Rhodoblastus acidophilus]
MGVAQLSLEGADTAPGDQVIRNLSGERFEFFPIDLGFRTEISGLYVIAHEFGRCANGDLQLGIGDRVAFDGYFTALYERDLAPLLAGRPLELRLALQGEGRVELWHCADEGEPRLRHAATVEAENTQEICIPFALQPSEQMRGRWWFELKAHRAGLRLSAAGWRIVAAPPPPVRPEIVICTFKRETQVSRNVSLLQRLLSAADVDFGVTVIDNAGTLARDPEWGERIKMIAQRNTGGAGGFSRGILETLRAGRASHIILMDDDAEIDGASVLRMINLFRLDPRPEVFYGGAQLDVFDPCRLADAGAFWRPSEFEKVDARLPPCDLTTEEAKDALLAPSRTNFNGFWFFGGAVDAFRRFGMPLPCFVHLDDVEYGVRVVQQGGRIVAPVGVAIWHEPYYAKLEGWFAYYNIRNELIRYCIQTETKLKPWRVLRRLHKRHRGFVLTQQYGAAALLSLAMDDFLRGPELLLRDDPEQVHMRVMAHYRSRNANARVATLDEFGGSWRPARRARGLIRRLVAALSFNGHLLRPRSLIQETCVFPNRSAVHQRALYRFARWAYCESGSDKLQVFEMDRGLFRACMGAMARAEARFALKFGSVARRWRESAPELRSLDYWENFKF